MPAYISHTIMARDVYNKIDNKNVNRDYMITFSLGGDLCKYSKCRKDSHNKLLDEFIYNMCDYMKENNLTHDKDCLGVLYGHICHVVMDKTIHPLVYSMVKICAKNKKNHSMIELYYDNYLSNKYYNVRLNKHNNKELFKGRINKKIKRLLNETYERTYKCNNISFYYKFNIILYKSIKLLYLLLPFNLLKKIVGMNKFLNNNKNIDLLNTRDMKLDELYNKSVEDALIYINKINEYLYN